MNAIELPFIAPIPRGHGILVVTFTFEGKSPTVVLDRTSSLLYCNEELWGPLQQDPVLAVTDPIAVVTRYAWTVKSQVEGICGGALMSGRAWGDDRSSAKTRLIIEPTGAPFR